MKRFIAMLCVLSAIIPAALAQYGSGQGSYGTIGLGGGAGGTNFAGIFVTNTAYAANFVATGTGTNVFDVTLFTNGVNAYVSSIDTNTAAIQTSSNPTNSYVIQTLYTNTGQRCLLIGSVAIPALTVASGAGMSIRYTNNAVGYVLQVGIAHANGAAGTSYTPFCIPMSVGATFKFETNSVNSAGVTVTNVVCWRL